MERLGLGGFGGGPSRRELQEALEAQRLELAQYQARLRDVVCAYKGLREEKEALEAGLRVLEVEAAAAGGGAAAVEEPVAEEEESGAGLGLRTRLSTLRSALATVSREKARMEASFQADRRAALREREELVRGAEEERGRLAAALAETRARLAAQQQERAREQGDHALMLRELQGLVQSERGLRREAERGLQEVRAEQSRQESEQPEETREAATPPPRDPDPGPHPDPRLQELRSELASLQSRCQAQLLQERRKAAQAEERVQMEEQRVAGLEAQISEVSELLGTYEKARQKDQTTIQKLKDRIVQLDLENKTLAIAASGRSPIDIPSEESNLDVNLLKDKMERLKKMLQVATKHSLSPQDVEAFCKLESGGVEPGDGEKASVAYYQQELKQLKEEFERYKLRAQVVLKNKSAKDGSLAKELEDTQDQLAELKEKYVALRLSCEEAEKQQQEEREAKKRELVHLQQFHRQELERSQLDYREKVFQLEQEMQKQRDRALAVLAEKDQELEQLRPLLMPPGLQGAKQCSGDVGDGSLESLAQALHLTAPSEPTFLLYTEQLARKEVEISALKKQKNRLEAELHHLQEKLLEEGEKHREEVLVLKGNIQKNFRDQSREGANLEYLKNIFYRFLTLTDWLGRQQTLKAILTILHFSPEEKQVVLRHSDGGVGGSSWWHSGKR